MELKEMLINKLYGYKLKAIATYYKYNFEFDITIAAIITVLALVGIALIWEMLTSSYIHNYLIRYA